MKDYRGTIATLQGLLQDTSLSLSDSEAIQMTIEVVKSVYDNQRVITDKVTDFIETAVKEDLSSESTRLIYTDASLRDSKYMEMAKKEFSGLEEEAVNAKLALLNKARLTTLKDKLDSKEIHLSLLVGELVSYGEDKMYCSDQVSLPLGTTLLQYLTSPKPFRRKDYRTYTVYAGEEEIYAEVTHDKGIDHYTFYELTDEKNFSLQMDEYMGRIEDIDLSLCTKSLRSTVLSVLNEM